MLIYSGIWPRATVSMAINFVLREGWGGGGYKYGRKRPWSLGVWHAWCVEKFDRDCGFSLTNAFDYVYCLLCFSKIGRTCKTFGSSGDIKRNMLWRRLIYSAWWLKSRVVIAIMKFYIIALAYLCFRYVPLHRKTYMTTCTHGYIVIKPACWLHYSNSNHWLFLVYPHLLQK